jgi:hypothetical protein
MPTEPLQSILDRPLSKVAASDVIEVASPLLQELVNYGTNALARCASTVSGGVDENIAVLTLYRHVIEMTDGIEVLVSQCCPDPTVLLLRSSFEALLSIEYILETEEEYVRRSLAWLVGHIHNELDLCDRLDDSTTKGRQFRRSVESDKTIPSIAISHICGKPVKGLRDSLRSFLKKPHVEVIEDEFAGYDRPPPWYHVFGGPANLCDLAKFVERGGQYEFLYRLWSETVHAQSASPLLQQDESGQQVIQRLRDPTTLASVASFGASFMLSATRLVLGRFRPGEDLSRWYKREVRGRYRRLDSKRRWGDSIGAHVADLE